MNNELRLFHTVHLSTLLLATVFVLEAQQKPSQTPKGKSWETDLESQFTGRYANCDYGFYVSLPQGYLAHGNHFPSPNHGFLIGLPDTGKTDHVSVNDMRFIWANAENNSFDLSSLKEAADWRTKSSGEGKKGFKVLRRGDTKLNGLAAKLIDYQYEGSSGTVIEEEVIALRAGILYEIGLRTNADDYKQDEDQFLKLIGNFRWWRIHYC
jgi:hypothetical protein